MTQIRLRVNGKPVADDVPPRLSLADFLRERRNLTGTHLGCEHGVCGACTILMEGEPVRACLSFAVACDGAGGSGPSRASATIASWRRCGRRFIGTMGSNAGSARRRC